MIRNKGATSQSIYFEILDSTSTSGGRKTGIAYNTSGLTAYYVRQGGSATSITLATLAAANSAYSSGGFKEVDATNMPGVYRLDIPDAALASGADSVIVTLKGVTGMVQVSKEIELTSLSLQVALPTNFASLSIDGNGRVDVIKIAGTTQTARDIGASVLISSGTGAGQLDVTSGVIKANLAQILGTALTETAGQIAAGFKQFFNISSPTSTMNNITLVSTTTTLTNAPSDSSGVTTLLSRLSATRAGYLDNLSAGAVATASKLLKYIQLMLRKDSAINTDNSAEVTEINANGGSGAGAYDNTTDAQEALRDRGDAAWTTGGGGSISDILSITPLIPPSVDVASTATFRLGLMLVNALDDLPTTGEITPGTISIDRKAIGGTSWTAVVTDAACSELAGLVYYDATFASGSYSEGDSLRITFKSQKITVSANDYEITDSNGRIFYSEVRQTERGTNSAYTGTPPTAAQIRTEMDSNSTQLAKIGTPAGASLSADVAAVKAVLPSALVSGKMDSSVGAYQSGQAPLQPTVAGRSLDVSAGGEAGVDWANIGSPTTTVSLSGTTVGTATTLTNAPSDSSGVTTLLSRLSAARAGYLDNLSAGAVATASKLLKYFQLALRKDAAIATDNSAEVTEINANGGSGAGAYTNSTDAQEALRDRGDAAWITGTAPLDAAGTRTALGMSSANLDTQFANLQADTDNIQTRLPAALVGGRIDSNVQAMANNVITSSVIATDAIGAAQIAADAIGSSELATSAVSEIQSGLSTLTSAQVNAEVVDALSVDTYAEPSSVPAATASLAAKLGWLFSLGRNKITQTATTQTLRNDADSGNISTSTVSDDDTTYTRGEWQ